MKANVSRALACQPTSRFRAGGYEVGWFSQLASAYKGRKKVLDNFWKISSQNQHLMAALMSVSCHIKAQDKCRQTAQMTEAGRGVMGWTVTYCFPGPHRRH